jgi:hypothetical protein
MNAKDRIGYTKTAATVAVLFGLMATIIYLAAHRPPRCKAMLPAKVACGGIDADSYCVSLPPCPTAPISR